MNHYDGANEGGDSNEEQGRDSRDGEENFSLFLHCSDVGKLLDISLQRRGVSC